MKLLSSIMSRVWTVGCVALAVLSVSGCIKVKQQVSVMPDGSGKMTFSMGFDKAKLQQAGGGEDPTDIDMGELSQNSAGIVAFSRPTESEKDGWKYVTFTAYFEDINKVRLGDGAGAAEGQPEGEGSKVARFVMSPENDGHKLEIHNGMTSDMASNMGGGEEEMPADQKVMMAMMFAGFEAVEGYTMPGKVTRAEGLASTEGRTASLAVKDSDLMDKAKMKALGGAKVKTIVCGASEVSEAELRAFKAEIERAKGEWVKFKAELEAKAKAEAEAQAKEAPDEPAMD